MEAVEPKVGQVWERDGVRRTVLGVIKQRFVTYLSSEVGQYSVPMRAWQWWVKGARLVAEGGGR